MTREFQFTPIATVELDDDGTLTLDIDWSASEQGELDDSTGEHALSPLSTQISNLLDAWVKANGGGAGSQRIDLGRLPANLTNWRLG